MSNPKKNYIYNIIYQLLILIIPLIISPYLSRVVGVRGIGIYSYTYSIVNYFILLTLLGVNNYGNRAISKIRDNKDELNKTFWSIYIFQLFMGLIMLFIYFAYIYIFDINYKKIAIIESLFIVSSMLDINWLFFGLEEFKKTIIRNTILKICSIILIFIFVKNSDDLWIYTLIMAGMTAFSQLVLWEFAKKIIKFVRISFNDIKKHIKPNLILFIPVIAISLYKIMDKVMLGLIANVNEVGYYENAEKIIGIPLALIFALGNVMLPRITNTLKKGDYQRVNKYIEKSISFVMFLSFAMCCGLIAISYNFAPMFYGKEFQKTGILMMLLATTLPFMALANVVRTQYLIPKEKDKSYILSVILGAVTNLIINALLIPKLYSIGACIGTIAAEIVVMITQILAVGKELNIKKYFINSTCFIYKSIIMLIVVYPLNTLNINSIEKFILQVLLGFIIYVLLNIKYIFSIIDVNKIPIINNKRKGEVK